jgi:ATPase subunit of ABC transporter with duplicated ATPase domains
VSHDRWFVSQLATRIVELTPQGPRDFPGTYAEYLARCGDDHLDADAVVLKARPIRSETSGDPEWEEKKRRRNRLAKLPVLRDKVLADIEAAEARKVEIQQLYCSPGFFEATSKDAVAALEKEQAGLDPRIETLMAEWEQLEREIAEAAAEQP